MNQAYYIYNEPRKQQKFLIKLNDFKQLTSQAKNALKKLFSINLEARLKSINISNLTFIMPKFNQDIYAIDSESNFILYYKNTFDIFIQLGDQKISFTDDLSLFSQNNLQQQLSENLQIKQPQTSNSEINQRDLYKFETVKSLRSQPQIYGYISPPEVETKIIQNDSMKKKRALNLNNKRIKSFQRQILTKLFKKDLSPEKENKKGRTGDQWTKNLLKVAKCSLCNFLRQSVEGRIIIQHNLWLQDMMRRDTFYLNDFDELYKNKCLEQILTDYFSKRILYRDLMISRVTNKNKQRYMYYLEIFEENFKIREFKGISEPKQTINKRKIQKKVRRLNAAP